MSSTRTALAEIELTWRINDREVGAVSARVTQI